MQKRFQKACNGKSVKCITHDLWAELEHHIMYFFEKNTLKDIIYRIKNKQEKEIN